jgi:sec-independent protein translocase protein TatB
MREAEMADIKKSFDDISAASRDLHPTKLLASLEEHAREREEEERTAQTASDAPAAETTPSDTPAVETSPSTEAAAAPEPAATPVEGQASALMKQTPDAPPTAPESKAS